MKRHMLLTKVEGSIEIPCAQITVMKATEAKFKLNWQTFMI